MYEIIRVSVACIRESGACIRIERLIMRTLNYADHITSSDRKDGDDGMKACGCDTNSHSNNTMERSASLYSHHVFINKRTTQHQHTHSEGEGREEEHSTFDVWFEQQHKNTHRHSKLLAYDVFVVQRWMAHVVLMEMQRTLCARVFAVCGVVSSVVRNFYYYFSVFKCSICFHHYVYVVTHLLFMP